MTRKTSALGLSIRRNMNRETALVTGSSSGIGLHLAHEFARHGHPLVLVAPVLSELENVAADIQSEHNVSIDVVAKDLENENAAEEIFVDLGGRDTRIDILVNNAGQGFSWQVMGNANRAGHFHDPIEHRSGVASDEIFSAADGATP